MDGVHADASSTDSTSFQMSATWAADNIGPGTGAYALGPTGSNSPNPYEAMTVDMTSGANYATNEILDGTTVGAVCTIATSSAPTIPAFTLLGYKSGDTLADALATSTTLVAPAFTGMTSDKFVLVMNHDCNATTTPPGVLHVDSITTNKGDATANGTFASGWQYTFHVTVPDNEPNVQMKFSDWLRDGGSGTIPVANNMRISSAQADNGDATILLTAADTYSTPALHMTGDLDTSTPGKQVDIFVEVAIPSSTPNGTYTTSYGIKSQ